VNDFDSILMSHYKDFQIKALLKDVPITYYSEIIVTRVSFQRLQNNNYFIQKTLSTFEKLRPYSATTF